MEAGEIVMFPIFFYCSDSSVVSKFFSQRNGFAFFIPSLNRPGWEYEDVGSYSTGQTLEYLWDAQLTSNGCAPPTALPKGQTQKDRVAHPPARPERTECVLDPKEANLEASQWPIMCFTQKSELGLSNSLLRIFHWKIGQVSNYKWKEKLIVSGVKEARGSIMSHVQVDVIRRHKLRASRNCEVESISFLNCQLTKVVSRERRKK